MNKKCDFNVIFEAQKWSTTPKYKFIREIGPTGPKWDNCMSHITFMKVSKKYVYESVWPLFLINIYMNEYSLHVHCLDGISSVSLANKYN